MQTAKVADLLLAVPKLGPVKVDKLLSHCRIAPTKTIGGLSARQRDELAALLAGPDAGTRRAHHRAVIVPSAGCSPDKSASGTSRIPRRRCSRPTAPPLIKAIIKAAFPAHETRPPRRHRCADAPSHPVPAYDAWMLAVLKVEITDQPGDLINILVAVGTVGAAIAAVFAACVAVWAVRRAETPRVLVSSSLVGVGEYRILAANEGPRAVTIENVFFLDAHDKPHFIAYKETYGGDTLPAHLVEGARVQLTYRRDDLPEPTGTLVVVRDSVGRRYETSLNPFLRGVKASLLRRFRQHGPSERSAR